MCLKENQHFTVLASHFSLFAVLLGGGSVHFSAAAKNSPFFLHGRAKSCKGETFLGRQEDWDFPVGTRRLVLRKQ